MGNKEHTPTHSQILGIIWLSVALILIAAVAFFSSRRSVESAPEDTSAVSPQSILASNEKEYYRQKSEYKHKTQYDKKIERNAYFSDSVIHRPSPPALTKQPLKVELNTADTLTLQLLHGIGPAYASRIVRYRERLGGFVSYDQLLEVYGFTPELLAHIKPYLTLDTTDLRHIAVNSITLKQLARHPYVEYYQARDIVRLRQSGVRFHSPDDLRAIPSMADSTLRRLLPYLDFDDSLSSENTQ